MNKLLDQTHFSAGDVLEIMGVQNPGTLDFLKVEAALCAHTPEADTYSEWINSEGRKVRTHLERPHSLGAVLAAAFDMGAASLVQRIRDAEGERLAQGFAPRLAPPLPDTPAALPAPAVPPVVPGTSPAALQDAPARTWCHVPSSRVKSYGEELDKLLERWAGEGHPLPSAHDVIEEWKARPPHGFRAVGDALEYRAGTGSNGWQKIKPKTLGEAISRRIKLI